MTTSKAPSGLLAGGAGIRITATAKTAVAQGHKAPKAIRRPVPKPVRPKVVDGAAPPALPAPVILWDDPVDPATDAKPKR